MSAKLIDGKAQAAGLLSEISKQVSAFRDEHGLPPGLAVILVGEDPASAVYVKSKIRKSESAGMKSDPCRLSADITQEELIAKIQELNARPDIHGILVQMPLPGHIDERAVVDAIDPAKDVDGLHPANAGRLVLGSARLVSCTPQGCIILAKSVLGEDLSGLEAVVLGRSILVGKPVALLLQNENCTVTMLHSRSRNMIEHCRRADILVVATGRAKMVQGDWIKPGATVIDVGINRITETRGGEEKGVLVGDVDFEAAVKVAGAITPVPGGVGPMTVACLLANTLTAARLLVAK